MKLTKGKSKSKGSLCKTKRISLCPDFYRCFWNSQEVITHSQTDRNINPFGIFSFSLIIPANLRDGQYLLHSASALLQIIYDFSFYQQKMGSNCSCQPNYHPDKSSELVISSEKSPETALFSKASNHYPSSKQATVIKKFPALSPEADQIQAELGDYVCEQNHRELQGLELQKINEVFKLSNGFIYQGQWHKGNVCGMGRFYLPDRTYLECCTFNREPIGKIRMIKNNGEYYEGFVKNCQANGEGKLFENGLLFTGNFVGNFLNGEGSEQGNGYTFQGLYNHGKKVKGIMKWNLKSAVPSVYEGEFVDEKFNGKGKLTNEIGQYQGLFQNGLKKGQGTFTWKNGARFEGQYDNNIKSGEGKMYNPAGTLILKGRWVQDKFQSATTQK